MVFEMEFEIDPAEEQETVPRDLRELRGTTCNRGALMTILPLAAFMMAALLRVLNVRELSCHRFGMCAANANANESQHANDQTQSTTRGRKLVQIHAGFDGSEALGAKRSNVPFKDVDGTPKDPLQIFKDHGYTYSRLRVMVGPTQWILWSFSRCGIRQGNGERNCPQKLHEIAA